MNPCDHIGMGDEVVLIKRHYLLPSGTTGHVSYNHRGWWWWPFKEACVWIPDRQEYWWIPHRKLAVITKYTPPIYVPGSDGAYGDYVYVTWGGECEARRSN